jgi:hypothetical protein
VSHWPTVHGAALTPAQQVELKGDGVHHAMPGTARLHNLALTG